MMLKSFLFYGFLFFISACSNYPIKVSEALDKKPEVLIFFNGIPITSDDGKTLDVILKDLFVKEYPNLTVSVLDQFNIKNNNSKYHAKKDYLYLNQDGLLLLNEKSFPASLLIINISSAMISSQTHDKISKKDSFGNIKEEEDPDNYSNEIGLQITINYNDIQNVSSLKPFKTHEKYKYFIQQYSIDDKGYTILSLWDWEYDKRYHSEQYIQQIVQTERHQSYLFKSNNLITDLWDAALILTDEDKSVKITNYTINNSVIAKEFFKIMTKELFLIKNKKKYHNLY